jgi:hypothetical protein
MYRRPLLHLNRCLPHMESNLQSPPQKRFQQSILQEIRRNLSNYNRLDTVFASLRLSLNSIQDYRYYRCLLHSKTTVQPR